MITREEAVQALKVLDDWFGSSIAGHYFCVGEATMFALNWNGTIDRADNGIGAWGAHTANKEIMGASLPEGVLIATCGFSGTWAENKDRVGKFLGDNKVQVSVTKDFKTVTCDIVDAGPSRRTHNCMDLTWLPAHQLNTYGKAIVSYSIFNGATQSLMEIKGWDFQNGVEILQPGVA